VAGIVLGGMKTHLSRARWISSPSAGRQPAGLAMILIVRTIPLENAASNVQLSQKIKPVKHSLASRI
jgi:hypothetical protein